MMRRQMIEESAHAGFSLMIHPVKTYEYAIYADAAQYAEAAQVRAKAKLPSHFTGTRSNVSLHPGHQ